MLLVLLAAGHGRRLGRAPSKGLVIVNGQPLIHVALAIAAEVDLSQIVVVTNEDAGAGMRLAIADYTTSSLPDLITATTRSAFESLLAVCRYAPSPGSTLVGTVDSVVSPAAVARLARSSGDGCLLVRPGDDSDGLYVEANPQGRVVALGAAGFRGAASLLMSAGWFVFHRDLNAEAEAAWAGGVRTLRGLQAWLVANFDIRWSVVDEGYDIDTPEDLDTAQRNLAAKGWWR